MQQQSEGTFMSLVSSCRIWTKLLDSGSWHETDRCKHGL